MVGDGSVYKTPDLDLGVRVVLSGGTEGDEEVVGELARIFEWKTKKRPDGPKAWKCSVPQTTTSRLVALGLRPMTAYEKELPSDVLTWSSGRRRAILSGLWQADGHCWLYMLKRKGRVRLQRNPRVVFGTVSKQLVEQVWRLLSMEGVKCKKGDYGKLQVVRVGVPAHTPFADLVELRGKKREGLHMIFILLPVVRYKIKLRISRTSDTRP